MTIETATRPKLTDLELFLMVTPDDTEDAPWMVMGTPQVTVIDVLKSILQEYARQQERPWVIESYLGIRMPRPRGRRTLTAAPDLLVTDGDRHDRTSWDISAEGKAPSFVLEVSSEASWERDSADKPDIYDGMGVQEYVIFRPQSMEAEPLLSGYRRDDQGKFVPWSMDEHGMLWSRELGGLGLYVEDGRWLRLVDQQGQRLPTPAERAAQEAAGRQAAEAELARLRAELQRRDTDPA